jgi:hypothetical protein
MGCSSVEHLTDVEEDDLREIGFLPLQIRRFFRERSGLIPETKASKTQPQETSTAETSQKVVVQMPSDVFGLRFKEVSREKLIAKYEELYYKEPQNLKMRQCNEFILGMLQAAEYRFTTKRKLIEWGRRERDIRWNILLSFASLNDVTGESQHFREQNINHELRTIKSDPSPAQRVVNKQKLEKLLEWAQSGAEKIRTYHAENVGKPGHSEAADFWHKLKKSASAVVEKLQAKLGDYADVEVPTKMESRKKGKNDKKAEKRKLIRSQAAVMANSSFNAKKRSRTTASLDYKKPQILEMFQSMKKTAPAVYPSRSRCEYPLY